MNLPLTTFHTGRLLANSLAKKAQELKEAIQKNNALKSVDTQLIYQEGHDLPFTGTRLGGRHIVSTSYPTDSEGDCRAV